MLLTYCKFAAFALLSHLSVRTVSGINGAEDLVHMISLTLVTLFLSWQVSGLLSDFLSSRQQQDKQKSSLIGKCVLITGCDTGFGHAMALHLNKSGFTVFAGCLFADRPEAKSLISDCKHPDNMHILPLDVTSESDVRAAYDRIFQHTKSTGESLYALVNNAAVSNWSPMEWGSMDQDIEPVIKVNLTSVVGMTRTFVPMLRRVKDSRVVFMTSYVTHVSVPFIAPYVVSKNGVKAFADALRSEVEADPSYYKDMKVLNVEPTAYKTGMMTYDIVSKGIDRTWSRTKEGVKRDYGHTIYDGFKGFIAVCKFFQFFDFLAVRSDLTEVAVVMQDLLTSPEPQPDTAVMPAYSRVMQQAFLSSAPEDFMESVFRFVNFQGMIFAFGLSLLKSWLRF